MHTSHVLGNDDISSNSSTSRSSKESFDGNASVALASAAVVCFDRARL